MGKRKVFDQKVDILLGFLILAELHEQVEPLVDDLGIWVVLWQLIEHSYDSVDLAIGYFCQKVLLKHQN